MGSLNLESESFFDVVSFHQDRSFEILKKKLVAV